MISIAMCLPKYLSCQGDSLSVSNPDNVDETELRKYSNCIRLLVYCVRPLAYCGTLLVLTDHLYSARIDALHSKHHLYPISTLNKLF
jgi:hypothetical protein